MNTSLDPWLNIHSYAHTWLVEQVMAVHGRGSSDPVTYRRVLERMDSPALMRALEESDFPRSDFRAPRSNDFPALSLTENAGVIASADTGHAPGSARETFSSAEERPQVMPTAGESPATTEAQTPAEKQVGEQTYSDPCASELLIFQSTLP